jgi:hypothetical protein
MEDMDYVVEQGALDRGLWNHVFKNPIINKPVGFYPRKLVEEHPSCVTRPLINADWDYSRSDINNIVKTVWQQGLPQRVENLYINFTRGKYNKLIGITVLMARVNRDTGETVWDTGPLAFSLLRHNYPKNEPIYKGFRFVDKMTESYFSTLHITVRVPNGDLALRVVFEQIDDYPPSKRHGKIFLSTFAANCKYNTLKWKECIFTYSCFQSKGQTIAT